MAPQPLRPVRPAAATVSSAQQAAASRPVALGESPAQQAMQTKAQQSSTGDGDKDDWDDEEDSALRVWLCQAPSWLTSMVFHMVLILILALIPLGHLYEPNRELTLFPAENETEDLNESPDEAIDELMQTDVAIDAQFDAKDMIDSDDLSDISDEVAMAGDAADPTLKIAVQVDFDPLLISTTAADVTEVVGGFANTGYGDRNPEARRQLTKQTDPRGLGEAAVEAALAWLAKVQRSDGSWNFNDIGASPDAGEYDTAMGATGLALLPFLGAGYTHEHGKYQEVVGNGLKYLVGHMGVTKQGGRLYEANGPSHAHMYSHGIAAMALCEAYGMAETGKLMEPAQLSLNYIEYAQHPENGGWLYTPRQGGDTSVVGWQIMALKSGHMSYLKVDPQVVTKADKWLDFVAWNSNSAYGYRKPEDRPADGATTAIGLLMRMYLGTPHDDPGLRMGVEALSKAGPHKTDMYYNYYATQVMRHFEGLAWTQWDNQMRDYLVKEQERQGHAAGSWMFTGGHGATQGGRLYNTAMATMILEVYYRHLPIYQKKSFTHKFGE